MMIIKDKKKKTEENKEEDMVLRKKRKKKRKKSSSPIKMSTAELNYHLKQHGVGGKIKGEQDMVSKLKEIEALLQNKDGAIILETGINKDQEMMIPEGLGICK